MAVWWIGFAVLLNPGGYITMMYTDVPHRSADVCEMEMKKAVEAQGLFVVDYRCLRIIPGEEV